MCTYIYVYVCIHLFNPHNSSMKYDYYFYFIDREPKVLKSTTILLLMSGSLKTAMQSNLGSVAVDCILITILYGLKYYIK